MKRKIQISNDNLNWWTYADTVGHYLKMLKIAVLDVSYWNLRQFECNRWIQSVIP